MSVQDLIIVLRYHELRVEGRTVYKYINECIPDELRQLRNPYKKKARESWLKYGEL